MLWSPDATQRWIFERAELDPDEPALMTELAARLGFAVTFKRNAGLIGDAECRYHAESCGWLITVRSGISIARKRFAVAHEIAEALLSDEIDEGLEDYANAVAACMLAPRRAYQLRLRETGEDDFGQMALPFGLTETGAALRAAEVQGRRLCVVTPHRIYARGDEWPEERTIRSWAQQALPGLRKTRLSDDERRVVLEDDAPPWSSTG